MKLKKIKPEYTDKEKSTTEIIYSLISSRNEGHDLIMLVFDFEDESVSKRIYTNAKRILRELHIQGRINYYALCESFLKRDATAEYIYNKFPEIEQKIADFEGKRYAVVRL